MPKVGEKFGVPKVIIISIIFKTPGTLGTLDTLGTLCTLGTHKYV